MDWQIAINGWSPLDWSAHIVNPQNFALDFPSGILLYDKSSIMHLYPLLYRWAGIDPLTTVHVFMFIEILIFAVAIIYLHQSIFPQAHFVSATICTTVILSSGALNMELSNFGEPYFSGLYYNFADALRLFGIAFVFRKRWIMAALSFSLAATIHPIMAMMAFFFSLAYVAFEKNGLSHRQLIMAATIFLVITLGWFSFHIEKTNLEIDAVSPATWVEMAKMFSFHFFPVDYGVLTISHDKHIVPLLGIFALSVYFLEISSFDRARLRGLLSGIFALIILCVIGLLVSVFAYDPFIIKMALQRASGLLVIILILISITGLVSIVLDSDEKVLIRSLAIALLLSPFLINAASPVSPGLPAFPGFPTLAVFSIVFMRYISRKTPHSKVLVLLALVVCFVVAVLGVTYTLTGVMNSSQWPAYFGSAWFWKIVIISSLVFLFLSFLSNLKKPLVFSNIVHILLAFITVFLGICWQESKRPSDDERKFGYDYLNTQLWAKQHSERQSLFMVDPTLYYGWRDFSGRSSFGNLREWLHTCWLYDSKYTSYEMGMDRFKEFGIDLELYGRESNSPSINRFYKLNTDVKNKFYSMSPEWFEKVSSKYKINYIVMINKNIHVSYPYKKVYENESFTVFKIN